MYYRKKYKLLKIRHKLKDISFVLRMRNKDIIINQLIVPRATFHHHYATTITHCSWSVTFETVLLKIHLFVYTNCITSTFLFNTALQRKHKKKIKIIISLTIH